MIIELDKCEVCGLREGDDSDGMGPLGKMSRCDTCGKWVCPVCLHEADCCFEHAEDYDKDPTWAPRGWKRRSESEFERIET